MNVKLLRIDISNFKGCVNRSVQFDGDTWIRGYNGEGKTTIFDAYLWLLFDQDSNGRKGPEAAKTTDGADFKHRLVHEVAAEFVVDNKPLKLHKELTEKWTKPRNGDELKYNGNQAKYKINGIPKQAKEYQEYIEGLIPQAIFQALTDPAFFSTQMTYKERLSILTQMSGEISNQIVAGRNPTLINLVNQMESDGVSLSDFRLSKKSDIDYITKKINAIEPLVKAYEMKQKNTGPNWSEVENRLQKINEEIQRVDNKLSDISKTTQSIIEDNLKTGTQISKLQTERDQLINSIVKEANQNRNNILTQIDDITYANGKRNDELSRCESEIVSLETSIARMTDYRSRLREDLSALKNKLQENRAKTFDISLDDELCPVCGQKLPDDKLADKKESLKNTFESQKKKAIDALVVEMQDLIEKGNATNKRISDDEAKKAELTTSKDELTTLIADGVKQLANLEEVLATTKCLNAEDVSSPQLDKLDEQINLLRSKNKEFGQEQSLIDSLIAEKNKLNAEAMPLVSQLSLRDINLKEKKEYESQAKQLDDLYSEKIKAQGLLNACDEFSKEKTKIVESRISSLFKQVSFKLFTEQINGNLSEACEAVVGNTTFTKANTAARVNAGLEIINNIAKHFDAHVPVWVDCLESNLDLQHEIVNNSLPVDSQFIVLEAKEGSLTISNLSDFTLDE